MKFLILLLIVIFELCVESKLMPTGIKTCRRNDPELNKCFETNANLAMKFLAQGNRDFGIIPLPSLFWRDKLIVETPATPGFTLQLMNISVLHLENTRLTEPSIDLNARHIQFVLTNELVIWKGEYIATVQVNNGTEQVQGNFQINFTQGEYIMAYDFDIIKVVGVGYANITTQDTIFRKCNITFEFENMDSNEVVKTEWNKAKKDFVNESVRMACAETTKAYLMSIFKLVPFDLVFTKPLLLI